MKEIAKLYLVEKLTRTEVKDAAVKALRDKEGLHVQVGGVESSLLKLLLI